MGTVTGTQSWLVDDGERTSLMGYVDRGKGIFGVCALMQNLASRELLT
jgi:hypothetical protein